MDLQADIVTTLPKVELHCHLDGSVSPEALAGIIREGGETPPGDEAEFRRLLQAPIPCGSLLEYLRPFPFVLRYLQKPGALEAAAYDVLSQAAKENVVYMELRFAPMLHGEQGLGCGEVVAAVLNGVRRAEKDFGIAAGLILCLMRGQPDESNRLVVDTARSFFGKGVAAVDLAGDEAGFPPQNYRQLFAYAAADAIPITIHAGENGPAGYVADAIGMGAARVGHGIALKDAPDLRALCIRRKVALEICPSSNLQTKAAASLSDYPFRLLVDEGVPFSVNTDNRTVSGTTLTNEFLLLQALGMDYALMEKLTFAALEQSFLPDDAKPPLRQRIIDGYADARSRGLLQP